MDNLLYHRNHLLRVFIKGGMIGPVALQHILQASGLAGNTFVLFGSREDILFPVAPSATTAVNDFLQQYKIDFEYGNRDAYQNIVSSAIALEITHNTSWLNLDQYRTVLRSFNYKPSLKINITDPKQAMVPLFTGHLNFIAAEIPNYWYLYVRNLAHITKLEKWPTLVSSNDLSKLSKYIDQKLMKNPRMEVADLVVGLAEYLQLNSIVPTKSLNLLNTFFPYYEGLNNVDEKKLWLGLYWRNNRFAIKFLEEACNLCVQCNIPFIYISPWKSFVIKGINAQEQVLWEKLMGQMGINMRHSSLELNWHIPVLDEEALGLKRYLVSELDQQDICTHGLTFTIETLTDKLWFTSIVIQKDILQSNNQQHFFNLFYAKDFNPNSSVYLDYAKGVTKEIIPALLIEMSKMYYNMIC